VYAFQRSGTKMPQNRSPTRSWTTLGTHDRWTAKIVTHVVTASYNEIPCPLSEQRRTERPCCTELLSRGEGKPMLLTFSNAVLAPKV
jgi:hypothetical protein